MFTQCYLCVRLSTCGSIRAHTIIRIITNYYYFFNDDNDFDAKLFFLSLLLVILQWFITVSEF